MKVLTAEQMRSMEAAADAAGQSYAAMMTRAGEAVAQAVDDLDLAVGNDILILVGPGNSLLAGCLLADIMPTLDPIGQSPC